MISKVFFVEEIKMLVEVVFRSNSPVLLPRKSTQIAMKNRAGYEWLASQIGRQIEITIKK